MNAISRRSFGLAAAAGTLTAAAAAACAAKPDSPPTPAAPPPSPGAGIGFVLSHEDFTTAQLLDQAQAAERAGFRYVWASDHIQPWQDNEGHAMFPWITLALVGQRTSHITFGTGVTCPIYRYHPTTVAQAFATLALLNPGRVFLGVGTGERLNEQAATTQFGSYRERHDRLAEAITLIRQLWSGQRISFQGKYFQTNQFKLYDPPPSPPPIYVAAGGPKSAHLAGQFGDGWITEAGGIHNQRLLDAFNRGAHASGRDPAALGKRVEMFAVVGDQARSPAPPSAGGSPPAPSTNPIRSRSSGPPRPTHWTKSSAAGPSAPTRTPTSGPSRRYWTPARRRSCISRNATRWRLSISTATRSCRGCVDAQPRTALR